MAMSQMFSKTASTLFTNNNNNYQRTMTPEEKAGEVVCGIDGEDRTERPYFNDLRYQLAQSYYWSGIFLKDFFFFVANWHPLFGMFCSHPEHPWYKKDRILTFIVSCSCTMLASAISRDLGTSSPRIMIFMCITLPVMILEIALYWIAIADIFCKGGRGECCCVALAKCVKHSCFCFSMFVSFFALSLSYMLCSAHNTGPLDLVRLFVISRIQSWILWFPLWFLLPCLGFLHCWCMEKGSLSPPAEWSE